MANDTSILTAEEKSVIADIKIAHCDLRAALQRAADLGMSVDLTLRYESHMGSSTKLLHSSAHIMRTRTVTDIDIRF